MPRTAVEIACNLEEIDIFDSRRYTELAARVRAAMRDRVEVPDGCVFSFDTKVVPVADVALALDMHNGPR